MVDTLAPLPDGGPATLTAVKAQLGITDDRSDTLLTQLVAVVNGLLRGTDTPTVDPTATTAWPVTQPARGLDDWTDPALAPVVSGASMLVARLYQRRNSPLGYEQVGDLSAVYVSRNDPDLAMLLQLGSWRGPVLG